MSRCLGDKDMNMVAKNPSGKSTHNIILIIFALIQIVLIGFIYMPRFLPDNNEAKTLLGDIKASDIVGLKISDGEQKISLAKDGDEWTLPEAGNFPVQLDKVTPFLDKLVALNSQSLVADSKASHKRLEVTDNDFVRKIDIELKGNKNITLYVGSSPTASVTHLRVGNQDSVYLNQEFSSQDANVGATSWVEAKYFEIEQDDVIRLRLQNGEGDLIFRKVGNNWKLIQPNEDENVELDQAAINSLKRKASSLRMVRPLGKEAKEEYGLEDPKATVTIVTQKELEPEETAETDESESEIEKSEKPQSERQTYTLTLGNELDDGFVVKVSESEYYVVVSNFNASDFVEQSKEDFIIAQEIEEASEEDLEGDSLESEAEENLEAEALAPEANEDNPPSEVSEEEISEQELSESESEGEEAPAPIASEENTPDEEVNERADPE